MIKMTRIELSPELRAALEGMHELARRTNEAMRPMLEVAARAAASLQPWRGALVQVAQAVRPLVESGWLEAIYRSFKQYEKALSNAEAMGRAGWTIPLNASLADCVGLLLAASTPEAADAAFIEFYLANGKESLRLLLADLQQQPKLEKFRPLLRETAVALDHELYRTVVTHLLPVLEDVAVKCWVDGVLKPHNRKIFFEQKFAGLEAGSFDHVAWTAMKAFVDGLWAQNHRSDPKPQMLNRNWILHGRGPADGSLADCLRLLQAIHTVLTLAEEEQPRVSAA